MAATLAPRERAAPVEWIGRKAEVAVDYVGVKAQDRDPSAVVAHDLTLSSGLAGSRLPVADPAENGVHDAIAVPTDYCVCKVVECLRHIAVLRAMGPDTDDPFTLLVGVLDLPV